MLLLPAVCSRLPPVGRYRFVLTGWSNAGVQADWAMMYEDEADTLRGYQRALFKGSPEEQPDAHKKSSPITYVDDVAAPLCA